MKPGVLFNAGAGGAASFPAIGQALAACFNGIPMLTCAGDLGGTWMPGVASLEAPALPFIPRLTAAVELLVRSGVDLLVCAGGDGFAAYCAEALVRLGAGIPLLGIAAGTANVGPLVKFDATKLTGCAPGDFRIGPVHALECSLAGRDLGLAFNDVVIGDTFLGTLDGRTVNLSVNDFLLTREKTRKAPSSRIAGPSFRVMLNGKAVTFGELPVQIVAAPLNESGFYRGKAVTGALCAAPWQGGLGALALCDRAWVSMEAVADGFCRTEHLIFGAGDFVELEGLGDDAQVVIDGNPFLRMEGRIGLRCFPDALRVVQA